MRRALIITVAITATVCPARAQQRETGDQTPASPSSTRGPAFPIQSVDRAGQTPHRKADPFRHLECRDPPVEHGRSSLNSQLFVNFPRSRRNLSAKSRAGREIVVLSAGIRNSRGTKRQLGRGVVLLLLLNLQSCLPDQTKSLTACQKEADQFFMAYRNDDPQNPRSRYIIECMATKGYDFTVEPDACDNRYPLTTQPTCYSPHGWLNWIQFELSARDLK